MIQNYISTHLADGRYSARTENGYENINGWTDYISVPHMIFSHRRTDYTRKKFYEKLHFQDYYEIVFYISGDVEYISGDLVNKPFSGNIIINRPGEQHTTRLVTPCFYERYALFFDPEFFNFFDEKLPIKEFFDNLESFAFRTYTKSEDKMRTMLVEIEQAFESGDRISPMIAYSKILILFSLISNRTNSAELEDIPKSVLRIKAYIDANAPKIPDVNAVAEQFFYSREHVSRVFKKYFNSNVSDYIAFRKAEVGKRLLLEGKKITEIAAECGFGSTPTFLRAFKKVYGKTPSDFLREYRDN